MGLFDLSAISKNAGEYEYAENLINYFFTDHQIRALMYTCLRIDIADNNDKARIVAKILGPKFQEVGTGTNRIAFRYKSVIVKIALDRRG